MSLVGGPVGGRGLAVGEHDAARCLGAPGSDGVWPLDRNPTGIWTLRKRWRRLAERIAEVLGGLRRGTPRPCGLSEGVAQVVTPGAGPLTPLGLGVGVGLGLGGRRRRGRGGLHRRHAERVAQIVCRRGGAARCCPATKVDQQQRGGVFARLRPVGCARRRWGRCVGRSGVGLRCNEESREREQHQGPHAHRVRDAQTPRNAKLVPEPISRAPLRPRDLTVSADPSVVR